VGSLEDVRLGKNAEDRDDKRWVEGDTGRCGVYVAVAVAGRLDTVDGVVTDAAAVEMSVHLLSKAGVFINWFLSPVPATMEDDVFRTYKSTCHVREVRSKSLIISVDARRLRRSTQTWSWSS